MDNYTTTAPAAAQTSQVSTDPHTNLEHALLYAARGWRVLPLHTPDGQGQCSCPKTNCKSIGKHPRTENGVKDATTDEAVISDWWGRWPDANIGIATGAESGIVVLDVDPRNEGNESLGALLREHGAFPQTPTSETGSGGSHYLFAHPGGKVKNSTSKLGSGLDFKADGGYIVAPPSLHASKRRYRWIDCVSPLAQLPHWLLVKNTERKGTAVRTQTVVTRDKKTPLRSRHKTVVTDGGVIHEGKRHDTLLRLAGGLRRIGLTPETIETALLGENERRCVPPVEADELRNIAEYVCGFPPGAPYTAAPDYLNSSSSSNSHVSGGGARQPEREVTPKLSVQALYGLAGDIVRAIEPHSEADPAALLVQTLVGFGNFVGRTAHFMAEADRHHMNLFAVIVGASSRGRKGSSWGHVRRLLEAVDEGWAGCIVGGLSSGEGLVHHVRDDVGTGNTDKRALVVETEFASVLRVQKRESNILSTTLRQAWDTGDLNVMRRNDPDKVRGAHVSIIGHITSDELKRCLQEADAVNGYANRFLWVHAQRSKKLPEGGYFHVTNIAPLVSRLHEAAEFARTVSEMKRDEEAAALWRQIYEGLDDEETGGQVAAILSRAEAQIMRLACVYALLDSSATVRLVHLEAAKALWGYCEASALYIFGGQALSRKAQKLLNKLNDAGAEGLAKTDIYATFGNRIKVAELSALLSELESAGYATKEIIGTGGHTEDRWYAVTETGARSCESDESDEESPKEANFDLCEVCVKRAAIIAADGGATTEEAERLAVAQCQECSEAADSREWSERVNSEA